MLRLIKSKNKLNPFKANLKAYSLLLLGFLFSNNQVTAQNRLSVFENLTKNTWLAEGKWGDGSLFKQEITFSYDLDSTIVIAKSKGFTSKEQTEFGDRNHGIRKWDTESETIQFWEFDVFGGVTKGNVIIDGQNIRYEYEYGGTLVSDFWEYIDTKTYNFTIGNYEEGKWQQKYLETQFKALNKP